MDSFAEFTTIEQATYTEFQKYNKYFITQTIVFFKKQNNNTITLVIETVQQVHCSKILPL